MVSWLLILLTIFCYLIKLLNKYVIDIQKLKSGKFINKIRHYGKEVEVFFIEVTTTLNK